MPKPLTAFRIHFADGSSSDRLAETPAAAREAVKLELARRGNTIRKVKELFDPQAIAALHAAVAPSPRADGERVGVRGKEPRHV
jgi:hypothetical protein